MAKITAQEAVSISAKYYSEVTKDYAQSTVEEVELTEDGGYWLVTLGHRRQTAPGIFAFGEIAYKIFKVDADTGEVASMKIKNVR